MQTTEIRTESRNVTTDLTVIERIVRKYYELTTKKLNNLDKMDNFLERQITKTDSVKNKKSKQTSNYTPIE